MDKEDFKNKIRELDKEFTEFVVQELINEPYVYFVPKNKFEEEKKFFKALSKGKKYEPQFEYENRPVKKILIRLDAFQKKFSNIDYPPELNYLKEIYLKKITELAIFTKMIGCAGEKEFTSLSHEAYGKPSFLLSNFSSFIVFSSKIVDSFYHLKKKKYLEKQEIKKRFESFCKKHRFEGWELEFSKEILSVAFILPSKKKVILNDSLKYDSSEILMLFKHELGVHGRRYVNGKKILGVFSFGLSRYDELEEGLATFEEFGFYNPLKVIFMPALKVVAVRTAIKKDFFGTFEKIYGLTGDLDLSFSLAMRVKRGVWRNKGAYTKDYLYFSGFVKVFWYYVKGFFRLSRIDEIFLGKIGFADLKRKKDLRVIVEFFQNAKN